MMSLLLVSWRMMVVKKETVSSFAFLFKELAIRAFFC